MLRSTYETVFTHLNFQKIGVFTGCDKEIFILEKHNKGVLITYIYGYLTATEKNVQHFMMKEVYVG